MENDATYTAEKLNMYVKICERAERMGICRTERATALMDIKSADKKFSLRLKDWLEADNFNFAHDFCGIQSCIVRDEYPATDFGYFLPRFAT